MSSTACRRCGQDYSDEIYFAEKENQKLRLELELKELEYQQYEEQLSLLKENAKILSNNNKNYGKFLKLSEKKEELKEKLNNHLKLKKNYLSIIEKFNNFFSYYNNVYHLNYNKKSIEYFLSLINDFENDYKNNIHYISLKNIENNLNPNSNQNNEKLLLENERKKKIFLKCYHHTGNYIRNSNGECEWTCCLSKDKNAYGCVKIPYSVPEEDIDENKKNKKKEVEQNKNSTSNFFDSTNFFSSSSFSTLKKARPKSASSVLSSSKSNASFFYSTSPKIIIPKDEKESLFSDNVNDKYMVHPVKQKIFEKNKETKTPSHYGFGSSLPYLPSEINTTEDVVSNVLNNPNNTYIFKVSSHFNNHYSAPLTSSIKLTQRNRPVSATVKRPGNPRTNSILTRQLSDSHIPILHPSPDLIYDSLTHKVGEAYNKTEKILKDKEKQEQLEKNKEKLLSTTTTSTSTRPPPSLSYSIRPSSTSSSNLFQNRETEAVLENFIETEVSDKPFGISFQNEPPNATLNTLNPKIQLDKTISNLEQQFNINSNTIPSNKFVYSKKNPLQNSKSFLKFK